MGKPGTGAVPAVSWGLSFEVYPGAAPAAPQGLPPEVFIGAAPAGPSGLLPEAFIGAAIIATDSASDDVLIKDTSGADGTWHYVPSLFGRIRA